MVKNLQGVSSTGSRSRAVASYIGAGIIDDGSIPEILPLGARTVFVGSSNTGGGSGASTIQPTIAYSGARIYAPVGANKGVSSDTLALIQQRLGPIWALACAVIVMDGNRNSIASGATFEQMCAAYEAIWSEAFAQPATKYFVQVTLIPRIVGSGWPQASVDLAAQMNVWLKQQHGRFGGRLRVVDVSNTAFDPATMTNDGQHLGVAASWFLSEPVGYELRRLTVPDSQLYTVSTDFGSLLGAGRELAGTAGSKTGTAGVITGDVATSCSADAFQSLAGLSIVGSKDVDVQGRNVQRFTLSGTVTTAGYFRFRMSAGGTFLTGQAYRSWIGAKVIGLTGALRMYCGTAYGAGVTQADDSGINEMSGKFDNFSADLVMSSPPIALPSDQTLLWNRTALYLPVGPVSGVIEFTAPTLQLAT